jgi:translation elongation factor EF-Tu-like GTPase
MSTFSETELAQLLTEVDQQLHEIKQISDSVVKSSESEDLEIRLAKQMKAIAQSTQEPSKTFLQKLHLAVKDDLCVEGGVLYGQWKKWGDLNNKDVLDKFGIVLTAFGLSGNKLAVVAVATTVIALHLGAKVFCEEFGHEP